VSTGRAYTLVYDGTCGVCTRIANLLRAWDWRGQIDIVASQAPGVMERFSWIPARAFSEAMQLVGPGNATWQGSDALEQLLGILPRGRLIAWIFHVPFMRRVADRFYRWFARNRYRLGCGDHCSISRHPGDA
jgi:predicted DCC family thiol-disulfide oxidoreductase YuxK